MKRELIPIVGLPILIVVLVVVGSRFVHVPTSPLEDAVAPPFNLPVMAGPGASQGDRIALENLRGRVVLLDFWASWCPPCRESIPILSRIDEEHRSRGVSVVGINVESLDQGALVSAHRVFGGTFPTVQDTDASVQSAYGVTDLPTLVVLDRRGVVVHVESGVPDEDQLVSLIEGLLD